MSEYCGCCGKFVWPSGDPPKAGKSVGGPSSEERSRTPYFRA
jgi:hypothetical protein